MKTLLILLFISAGLNLSAQNCERKNSFQAGFTFSYLPETVLLTLYDADLQYHPKQFYGFGFTGIYYIGEKFAMETGVSLSKYTIGYADMNSGYRGVMKYRIVSIPVIFRYSFLKYAFISTGPTFDFSLQKPAHLEQTGIGLLVGPGFQYEFFNHLNVIINPYITLHSWISYETGLGLEHILDGYVKAGLYYRF